MVVPMVPIKSNFQLNTKINEKQTQLTHKWHCTTTHGTPMVPKVLFSKSARSKLFNAVSTIPVIILDQKLQPTGKSTFRRSTFKMVKYHLGAFWKSKKELSFYVWYDGWKLSLTFEFLSKLISFYSENRVCINALKIFSESSWFGEFQQIWSV